MNFSHGVDQPSSIRTFEAAQRENLDKNLNLSTDDILDIIQQEAVMVSGSIEDTLYGGVDQTMNNIQSEINRLRKENISE